MANVRDTNSAEKCLVQSGRGGAYIAAGQAETPGRPAQGAQPQQTASRGEQTGGVAGRLLTPKFWDGIIAWAWFPLLWRNRFRVSPRRWFMALVTSLFSLVSVLLWMIQELFLGRKIRKTEIKEAPIFVIGHWRSGTTLLHELLVLDPRHAFPKTYDVFASNHFLISAWLLRPIFGLFMPRQRPMDNMAAGLDCPQEDEFALCNMGVPSPYLTIAFPNHPPVHEEYFELEQVPPGDRLRWQRALRWFLQCLTFRDPRRIVLKSPPHTFRIRALLEIFPRARFVHIVRNPYVVVPSTIHLWKRLYQDEGLQTPRCEGLEEYVLEHFQRMHASFERQRHLIPAEQFCELRYEDLVADPLGQMRAVYERLGLGDFEQARPAMETYFAEKSEYQTNRYQPSPKLCDAIADRCGAYLRQHGYGASAVAGASEA